MREVIMAWGKIKINTADQWFSKAVRLSHDYTCERCGRVGGPTADDYQMQNCHIIGRRNNSTRFAVCNTICMCVLCHRETGDNIDTHNQWIIDTYGQARMDRIHLTARGILRPTKANLKVISDHYRNEHHRMQANGDRDLETWN
jgi:hypothetical protein